MGEICFVFLSVYLHGRDNKLRKYEFERQVIKLTRYIFNVFVEFFDNQD